MISLYDGRAEQNIETFRQLTQSGRGEDEQGVDANTRGVNSKAVRELNPGDGSFCDVP